jgi:peptidoglycan-associated lipoprotein
MHIQEKIRNLLGVLASALIIAGCASTATEPVEPQPAEDLIEVVEVVEVEVEEAVAGFAADNRTPIDASGNPISRTFYFDFDQSVVGPADFAALEVHAQILAANPDRRVVIAGHCDQRGTREYNLALGERRAQAISAILIGAGANPRQIEEVSFGEEQLADPANTNRAWALNRRAVVSYR